MFRPGWEPGHVRNDFRLLLCAAAILSLALISLGEGTHSSALAGMRVPPAHCFTWVGDHELDLCAPGPLQVPLLVGPTPCALPAWALTGLPPGAKVVAITCGRA